MGRSAVCGELGIPAAMILRERERARERSIELGSFLFLLDSLLHAQLPSLAVHLLSSLCGLWDFAIAGAGAWHGQLVPGLGSALRVTIQAMRISFPTGLEETQNNTDLEHPAVNQQLPWS